MSPVATRERTSEAHVEEPRSERPARRLFGPGGATFEDLIIAAWEDLLAGRHAECPVCGGSMSMIDCADCGSELS